MSGDQEQDYFADGISEDIITALSKLRWFYLMARNSSFAYKGKSVHIKQLGEELGVEYIVEGSVRKDGDHVRITAQLNDVATGGHLWAERYDRALADVFAVQDEITQVDRRRNRAAALRRGKFSQPPQDARQYRRLGPGDAGAFALLAGDAGRQSGGAGAFGEGDHLRPPLRPGAGPARRLPHVFGPYGLGGDGTRARGRRALGACRDPCRQRGRLGALCAGERLSVQPPLRQFARRVRAGAKTQSEFLAGARDLWRGAVLLRPLGGGRPRRAPGAAAVSA